MLWKLKFLKLFENFIILKFLKSYENFEFVFNFWNFEIFWNFWNFLNSDEAGVIFLFGKVRLGRVILQRVLLR